jgi:hypothetical protein
MDNVSNLSGVFIFDMDEVLVDIGEEMYTSIRHNWRKYNMWFKDLGPMTYDQILARPDFHINKWLLKDEYKNLPQEKRKALTDKIYYFLDRDFFSKDFYSKLKPTEFARKTLMNPVFMDHARVKKVYIVTRSTSPEMVENKKRFIARHFKHPKVESVFVGIEENKSDAVKALGVNWNIFVDDELRNIRDFAENFDLKGKEFLIPATGYNVMPPLLDALIRGKGGTYTYFKKG